MNLTNILTNAISVIIECFVVIYYSNSVMKYKHNRTRSNLIIIIGYAVYCCICFFKIPTLNLLSFIGINFFVLYLGFDENISCVSLRVIILTVLMMFCELITSLFINIEIEYEFNMQITLLADILFTITSKFLYCTMVIILKRLSVNHGYSYKIKEMLWLLLLPISTCIFMGAFSKIYKFLNNEMAIVFVLLSVLLVLTNFIIYIVCNRIIDKNEQINYLQKLEYKQETDLKSYQLIKEKYADLKILVHDFNKYCSNIEAMLTDSQAEALSLIHKLENKNKEFLLVEYTNNKALNILLSQKMEECNKEGIDFQIYIQDVEMSFISEIDIVAIFANLMDNAIEGSRLAKNKKIFLSIYDMNNSFIVIRIDNSSDTEPTVIDGKLNTSKKDKNKHGIGMLSIKRALQNYNGNIQWSYNSDTRVFNTIILINYLPLNEKN